jgi:hypothetical protein
MRISGPLSRSGSGQLSGFAAAPVANADASPWCCDSKLDRIQYACLPTDGRACGSRRACTTSGCSTTPAGPASPAKCGWPGFGFIYGSSLRRIRDVSLI